MLSLDKIDPDECWIALQPTIDILQKVNPTIAEWIIQCHEENNLIFEQPGVSQNRLAMYDVIARKVHIYPALFAGSDGDKAAVIAHEYRHSRQNFWKFYRYLFVYHLGGMTDFNSDYLIETEANYYEKLAGQAIFHKRY